MTIALLLLLILLGAAIVGWVRAADRHVQLMRSHVRAETQRREDATWLSLPGVDLSNERRIDLLARVAQGETLDDIFAADWSSR